MHEILKKLINHEVGIACTSGENNHRGRIKTCAGGIVALEADGRLTYIAIDKIISVTQR
ncbi:MAG: MM0924 family protein [Acidobacteriota bacterium]